MRPTRLPEQEPGSGASQVVEGGVGGPVVGSGDSGGTTGSGDGDGDGDGDGGDGSRAGFGSGSAEWPGSAEAARANTGAAERTD
jgi:hypothetical protein